MAMEHELVRNLDKVRTTELGLVRIRRNLSQEEADIIAWCKQKIQMADKIIREGKNWYVHAGDCILTVNAHSFTIITAHRKKCG